MANQYYLVSQLPCIENVDAKGTLPITEKYYRDLCSRFLDPKSLEILESLSLEPPKQETSTGSDFLDKWNERERCLRLALAQIRAAKMKKESEILPGSCTADIVQAARTAVGMDSPLAAEEFLNQYRLETLDSMAPIDIFSVDAVFAYGIRLMLCQRIKLFDKEKGKVSYRKIYDEILGETT
ncbi:MAG: DUF2764 domain-containing protein [Treponema sp.]|nr:DUF2764 domain-containing protein [Treponema sp.]